ncbi:GNAT family N-acetyltransferase [Pseudoblastomonas halimionae]|uniref:GNAT family N-acetyltransferase n=1 Tax=Alteriqipengyuania halimionae TaxID=1926630 RepID=A0A6I4U7F4_9SPHN|nr:GNAT family N-acetyltransferase [Alteriqipengyuania halimionae]MXP10382.1 GNAT family N-acetyltransferase [Alteriqipengyuania halimionae]
MDRQPTLENERILLRPLTADDREALYAVASDPMVWEQHPIHDRWRRDVFDPFFDDCLASGGSLVAIRKDQEDRIVGSSRFDGYDEEEGGSVEIGWTYLERRQWGKGVNTSIKRMMLAHAYDYVSRVDFRVGDTNWRSRYALERIGAVRSKRYELERYQGKRVVHLVYELTREDFERGPLNV